VKTAPFVLRNTISLSFHFMFSTSESRDVSGAHHPLNPMMKMGIQTPKKKKKKKEFLGRVGGVSALQTYKQTNRVFQVSQESADHLIIAHHLYTFLKSRGG